MLIATTRRWADRARVALRLSLYLRYAPRRAWMRAGEL